MKLSMDLWHLNNMKVILILWTLNYKLLCSFFVLILPILFTMGQTNSKNFFSRISKKHDLNSISDYVGFDEIKWLCAFTKYILHKNLKQSHNTRQWVDIDSIWSFYLILNAKKLMQKYLWKWIFRASRRKSFSYFPKAALDQETYFPISFRIFCGSCYNIQFKPYSTSKMGLFATKIGNSWILLLIVMKS